MVVRWRTRRAVIAVLAAMAVAAWPGVAATASADEGATTAELLEVLGSKDDVARAAAKKQLVERGADVVPELGAALADKGVRVPVLEVLTELGPDAAAAVPAITKLLRGASSPARLPAVRTLEAIGAAAEPAARQLAKVIASAKGPECVEAAMAFQHILLEAAGATPRAGPRTAYHDAVDAGCDWLVRHQAENGSWLPDRFLTFCNGRCPGKGDEAYAIGVTGLAVTALLQDPTPEEGEAADKRAGAVRRGVAWLVSQQGDEGRVGPPTSIHSVYNHGAATLALATAVANGHEDARPAAEKAVAFALAWQNELLGWRYGVRDGQNDTSVTAWMVKALHAAVDAGVGPPEEEWQRSLRWASNWVVRMTDPDTGRTGYQNRGGHPARTAELMERYPADRSGSLTAAGAYVLLLTRQAGLVPPDVDARYLVWTIPKLVERLRRMPPRWDPKGGSTDPYYWMHGSAAAERAAGEFYVEWRKALLEAVLPHQIPKDGACSAGSWPALGPWAEDGGRVYTTSALLLALEACADDPATRPRRPSSVQMGLSDVGRAAKKAAKAGDKALAARLEAVIEVVGSAFPK